MSKRLRAEETSEKSSSGQTAQGNQVLSEAMKKYEQSLTFFMANVGKICARLNEFLRKSLPYNPKARPEDEPTEFKLDPLPPGVMEAVPLPGGHERTKRQREGDDIARSPTKSTKGSPVSKKPHGEKAAAASNPTSPLLRRPPLDASLLEEQVTIGKSMMETNTCRPRIETEFSFPAFPSSRSPTATPAKGGGEAEQRGVTTSPAAVGAIGCVLEGCASPMLPSDATKTAKSSFSGTDVPQIQLLIMTQFRLLKQEARSLTTIFDHIHDWLALNIPDMKEEDNSGVELLGLVIGNVAEMTNSLRNVYHLEQKYLHERSEFEVKLVKFPDMTTAKQALEVFDSNQWDDIEKAWRTLIRISLIMYNLLSKNMKKLKEPRSRRHYYAI